MKNNTCVHRASGRKIKAFAMHTFGHPAKIKELVSICKAYHISVVEDAIESGSFYQGSIRVHLVKWVC